VPILLTIAFGIAFVGALFFAISALEPFLKARRLHREPVRSVATLAKGTDVTVRGTIAEARRSPPYPRLTAGPVVFSQLQVLEQVGKQVHVALRSKNAQVFTIRDESGATIDVDPEGAELVEGHATAAKVNAVSPEVRDYVNRAGSFRWQNTPATCQEEAVVVGDCVTVRGRVILPMPGQMKEGDSELRITAIKLAVWVPNPWKRPSGRTIVVSLLVAAVSGPAAVACAAWSGLF
jgi:hypothetical protein